ncbi:MAG: tripartite tricarboxylate transporter substrate-binding protein [Burkholderiales bacterium]
MRRVAAALLVLAAAGAQAADWPDEPLHLSAGIGAAPLARMLAPALAVALGEPVVIDPPGVAAPEGYGAVIFGTQEVVDAVLGHGNDARALAALAPVSMVARMPLVVLAGPRAGFGSLQGLIEVARHNPNKLAYASSDRPQEFAAALLFEAAGIRLMHVPYRGVERAFAAAASNEVQVVLETAAAARAAVFGGELVALAVTSSQRVSGLPMIPTVAEAGLPGFETSVWYALALEGPAQPEAVVRLGAALEAALAREDVRRRMAFASLLPAPGSAAALAAKLKTDLARWREVRDKAGIERERP